MSAASSSLPTGAAPDVGPDHHVAELNVGRLVTDPDDPRVAPFMEALARINALAERSPGFVWRLKDGDGPGATGQTPFADEPRVIPNLSVWTSAEALRRFAFDTVHNRFFVRRAEWFEPFSLAGEPWPHFVMWPVKPGETPSLAEAVDRLGRLRRDGPSAEAFGWAGWTA